jgi:hypothetical protein
MALSLGLSIFLLAPLRLGASGPTQMTFPPPSTTPSLPAGSREELFESGGCALRAEEARGQAAWRPAFFR